MRIITTVLLFILLALVLTSCSTKEPTAPLSLRLPGDGGISGRPIGQTYLLTAGQHIDAGYMYVWNDANNLYIEYHTENGWLLTECQAQVGAAYADIADNNGEAPSPGQLDFNASFSMPYPTSHTFTIPFSQYQFVIGQTIYWAAHCSVVLPDGQGGYQNETGWGGNQEGAGPRWWFWDTYLIQEPGGGGGGDEYQYETAMMRMYDVPNDYTYRWRMNNGKFHPWFGFVKTTPVLQPQTYYFYAGKHYKAGEVEIWKEGDFLKVEVNMMNNWIIDELHLDIRLIDFMGAPAFGNFAYTESFDPAVGTYTFTVPWDATWTDQQLNIALHGAVKVPIVRM